LAKLKIRAARVRASGDKGLIPVTGVCAVPNLVFPDEAAPTAAGLYVKTSAAACDCVIRILTTI